MQRVEINARFAVASQPAPGDFAEIVGQGYRTLVNLRPDAEEPGQAGNAVEAAAAAAVGLNYVYIPITAATLTEADIHALQQVLQDSAGPVLAHCKSGTRALLLYTLGEVLAGRMQAAELIGFGERHGFDLAAATRWLERDQACVPRVKSFYDARTGSLQYVVIDPASKACAIIDPVHDFDEKSGSTATTQADAILDYIRAEGLRVEWILETHPHADHFSAAHYLQLQTGAVTAIGEQVTAVQALWKAIYHWPALASDGSQWDHLFADGDTFSIGSIQARVLASPGHTPASVTYLIGDAAFVHDTLLMPDAGTARADFPGGDAGLLWDSCQHILSLPDATRVFTGHDYRPGGRTARWESTVGEQKRSNLHLRDMSRADYVVLREARDRSLPMPQLLLPAIQVNIAGGRLPEPESNGLRYLKLPLNALPEAAW